MNNSVKVRKFSVCALVIVLIACAVCVCNVNIFLNASAISDFSGGTGTAADPYIVSTKSDFINVRYHMNSHFVQTENIDLSEDENFPIIGSISYPFTGHYNGGKYIIRNLNISAEKQNGVGLFSFINGGTVENVRIEKAKIIGGDNVGAIAGANKGKIIGCYTDAEVYGKSSVGGITGNNAGSIENSVNKGAVVASKMFAGGIAGSNFNVIRDCYNAGNITGTAYVAGITGVNNGENTEAVIERIFNVGEVSGIARGNLVGDNLNAYIKQGRWIDGSVSNLAAAFNFSLDKTASTGEKTAFEFSSKIAFEDWQNFDSVWMFLKDSRYPILKAEYIRVDKINFNVGKKLKLQPGEFETVSATVSPSHASELKVNLSVESNGASCEFDSKTGLIKIKENARVGTVISLVGESDGIREALEVEVIKIPVESIKIKSKSGKNAIVLGGELTFETEVLPMRASNKEVQYRTSTSFADISYFGVLTVSDDAPIGLEFSVIATSYDNAKISDEIIVTIAEPKVKSVKVINTAREFKVTNNLELHGQAEFENSVSEQVTFRIISSTANGAVITGDKLSAFGVGTITIVAQNSGITSEEYTVTVLPEPVVKIEFTNRNTFSINDELSLNAVTTPHNATNNEIFYEIIGANVIGAILDGNILKAERVGTVTVKATADSKSVMQTIYAEDYSSEENIAVTDIAFTNSQKFVVTQSLNLQAEVIPFDASNQNVRFTVYDAGGTGATISKGVLKATKPGFITLTLQAGDFKKQIVVEAQKEAVTDILYKSESFKITERLTLNVTVLPILATYKTVTYEIISSTAANAVIDDNNVLSATGIGAITVRATADGYYVDIIIEAKEEPVTNILYTGSKSFKHTESLTLSASVLPALATAKDVKFSVDENPKNTTAKNAVINGNILTAGGEGDVTVIMTAGKASFIVKITVTKEPVIGISELRYKLESPNKTETIFRTSGKLYIIPSVYPTFATNQKVWVKIIDDCGTNAILEYKNERSSEFEIDLSDDGLAIIFPEGQQAKAGIIKIQVISSDNDKIVATDTIFVREEFVAEAHLSITKSLTYRKMSSPIKIGADKTGKYDYYSEISIIQGGKIYYTPLAYANNNAVTATYEDRKQLPVYFLENESDLSDKTKWKNIYLENNAYFDKVIIENGIIIKSDSPWGSFWLIAASEHGVNGDVISKIVKVNVESTFIGDLEMLKIDSMGHIFTGNGTIKGMKGYEVNIKSGNKINITKHIITDDTNLDLFLFRYSLPAYEVSVTALFGEENQFRFSLPVKHFTGILMTPKKQLEVNIATDANDTKYNTLVIYDLSFSATKFDKSITAHDKLQLMYIYGNPNIKHTGLDFKFNNAAKEFEVILDGANFVAKNDNHAIEVGGEGKFNLTVKNNSRIQGGKGTDGKNGEKAEKDYTGRTAPRGEGKENAEIAWIGGQPNGVSGGNGDPGADGTNGNDGTNGINGGYAIKLKIETSISVKVDAGTLSLLGGDGGNGGNGSNGGGGQNGGAGGMGGAGSCRYLVLAAIAGDGGNGGNGGKGGNAGRGGKAGTVGEKGLAINNSKELKNVAFVNCEDGENGKSGSNGKDGTVGKGGKGAYGGAAGYGVILVVVYEGKQGIKGTDGANGTLLEN